MAFLPGEPRGALRILRFRQPLPSSRSRQRSGNLFASAAPVRPSFSWPELVPWPPARWMRSSKVHSVSLKNTVWMPLVETGRGPQSEPFPIALRLTHVLHLCDRPGPAVIRFVLCPWLILPKGFQNSIHSEECVAEWSNISLWILIKMK